VDVHGRAEVGRLARFEQREDAVGLHTTRCSSSRRASPWLLKSCVLVPVISVLTRIAYEQKLFINVNESSTRVIFGASAPVATATW
jgi:hypothetical protein